MERPSEAPHSGGSPWKGLLITASILSCWIQLISAQSSPVPIVPNPLHGTVGGSVILDIQGFSEQALSYNWYRNTTENSNRITSYHVSSGVQKPADIREKVFSNGSLLIPNLTLSDTDVYIVQIVDCNGVIATIARAQLRVYEELAKPNISASSTNVIENGTVVFTCSTENEGMNILWFFNDQPLSLNERMNTSEDNQTLTIKSVKREDAGSYQCEVWNPIGARRSDSLTLTVNYGPEHIVILPSPESGEIEARLKDPLTLVCHTESHPTAQYEWQVNGTKKPDFPNNTYIIKSASWEDSGKYTCLAKNNVTNLSVSKDVTIKVVEELAKSNISASSTNVIENGTVVLTCSTENEGMNILWFFNNQPLLPNERRKMSEDNQTLTIKTVKREDAGSYQCEVWNLISARRSDSLTLTVNYGPEHIMILPSPESGEIEVRLKDPLTLVCHVVSYPAAQYEWQVNGTIKTELSHTTYIIKSVSWEDSGKYKCLAKNDMTKLSISKDVTIKVVDMSPGKSDGSSLCGGAIAGSVIGVLAGMILIQTLLYFLFFRKTGRASKHHLSEENPSAPKHCKDTTLYENTVCQKGTALPAQGLYSSPAFPKDPPESAYQALDITRVDVYDRINPGKSPKPKEEGKVPSDVGMDFLFPSLRKSQRHLSGDKAETSASM
ncbi:carcinoembryonic antigen-related cell adhesion molecule 1-like [Dromiciops gliroides]|uniref:carcinoembryonic antigen-related cell adhesion molecule 1-like n=1 Tax=Dromiciops gliroides TaxID=33562 RepID=UPI001CC335CF|nr:carcinoembryonic antigen-related cell adhesion molecule 1-like [Dromiciops gliroides]